MSNQLETFMPYFKAMVKELGIDVTKEQEKGVILLMENMVTADQAVDVCNMLHLDPGAADLYISTLEYCVDKGVGAQNADDVGGSATTISCPHCGGAIGISVVKE